MIPNIVGPNLGATDLKVTSAERKPEKDFKDTGPDSFGKALQEKIASPDNAGTPRDNGRPEEVKEEKDSEAPPAKPDKEVVTPARHKAIKKFMDSFESEFEISPTRLVEAIAKLDKSQQSQPPEDTAKAVIDQLHLPKEASDKAQAMYASLLLQLHQIDLQPKKDIATTAALGGGALLAGKALTNSSEALGKVDAANGKLLKETDLPGSAGMIGAGKITGEMAGKMSIAPEDASAPVATEAAPDKELKQAQGKEVALPQLPPHVQGQMNESLSPALLAALAAQRAQLAQAAKGEGSEVAEGADEAPPGTEELAAAIKGAGPAKAESANLNALALGAMASKEASQNGQDQAQSQMQNNHSDNFAGKAALSEKDLAKAKLMAKATEFKQALSNSPTTAVTSMESKVDGLKTQSAVPVAAATVGPQAPTQAEHDAAVKQMMNQAQYLIKKGGGEVKVQMSPEGMGTVHLKVMLENGKINLQMSASTPEAKKMLEAGLADLKTSLAAHKLSVDHVKVDVVGAASADVATQNQTQNQNGHSQRDSSRQFWNQFNENFGSEERRQAQMEMPPNLKGYGPHRPEPLQPVSSSGLRPRSVTGKGSGLNLVA